MSRPVKITGAQYIKPPTDYDGDRGPRPIPLPETNPEMIWMGDSAVKASPDHLLFALLFFLILYGAPAMSLT